MHSAAPNRFDTIVIGGGQSGLAAGYHLNRAGCSFLIVDANQRSGDAWRGRWDSLQLFSPAQYDSLPGLFLAMPKGTFPRKDVPADYLEHYAVHFTLVDDNGRWQTLIADDILWELAYAPLLGHPAQLSGRKEAVRHSTWFVGAVENFRFFDLNVYALADVQGAVAEVKGEGLIKSTGPMYRQDYVVFLRPVGGKIAFLREYFDPVRAAKALDTPILGLES